MFKKNFYLRMSLSSDGWQEGKAKRMSKRSACLPRITLLYSVAEWGGRVKGRWRRGEKREGEEGEGKA